MPGSIIRNIKNFKCGWDGKILGKGTPSQPGHSHKELMKCLYKSNVELYRASQEMKKQEEEYKNLQAELGKQLIKERDEKEATGLMDVKEEIRLVDAPPLNIGKDKVKNDKELAKDLLEAESVIDNGSTD